MDDAAVKDINKRLADRYGSNLSGQPHFRLVWSNDQYEIRVGTFNEFSGPIFVRQYKGAKKVLKYNYIRNRWILEMWHEQRPLKELPEPDGYEPLYVFEDKNGNSLPPIWRVVEFICWNVLHPIDSEQRKQELDRMMEETFNKDVKYFEDMFDMSALQSRFHWGEAVNIHKNQEIN